MRRKFVGDFRLAEASARPGCPVCRCLLEDGRRQLDALMYEQVTDVETRRRLRGAWGLCNWHTWMLLTLGSARTGAAIVHEDLLRVAAEQVDRLRDRPPRLGWLRALLTPGRPRLVDRYTRRARCPVCLAAAEAEGRYLDSVVDGIDDPPFASAYARSTGLCVPHLIQAIDRRPGRPELTRLLDRTLEKYRELRGALEGFVRKHEDRDRGPISEAEAAACATALEIIAGARGVFGNDLHRPGLAAPGSGPSPERPQ